MAKKTKTTNQRLRALMEKHKLDRKDVAELLGKKLNSSFGKSNSTVDSWLYDRHNAPEMVLELLEFKLLERELSSMGDAAKEHNRAG